MSVHAPIQIVPAQTTRRSTWTRLGFDRFDAGVGAVVAVATAGYVALAQRGSEFYSGDTSYLELARALRHGTYGFNFRVETMLPPGFPALLAAVAALFGDSHLVFVRATAVCATVAAGAAYLLLRREAGRRVAAVVVVAMLASPTIFRLSTQTVISDLPYLLTSLVTLLLADTLARADGSKRLVLSLACGASLIASLLLRSAGVTLVLAIVAWAGVRIVRDPRGAWRRCRVFVPVVVAGLIVQGAWMSWIRHYETAPDWPIGGYPQAYTSQFWVRNGNQPELGRASVTELPARAAHNLTARAAAIVQVTTGKGGRLPRRWFSPWVVCVVLLIVLGLASSLRRGGEIHDWYFIAHETMYLLWPWDLEVRFIVPVVPLACLYAWRGVRIVAASAVRRPRAVAATGLAIASVCVVGAVASALGAVGLRSRLPIVMWTITAGALVALAYAPGAWRAAIAWYRRTRRAIAIPFEPLVAAAALLAFNAQPLAALVRDNLGFDVTVARNDAEIRAAQWIGQHTPIDTVIMARQLDVAYHYAERRVVWFPPITDPEVLYAGILKHHVSLVLVFDRPESYWRPAEGESFRRLLDAHPSAFEMVEQDGGARVYTVCADAEDDDPTSESLPIDRAQCERPRHIRP